MNTSQDGADLGVKAEAAMHAVIGGDPLPPRAERLSPGEMHDYLKSAPSGKAQTYDDASRQCGKLVLELFEQHPELSTVPMDEQYEMDEALAKTDWSKAWEQRTIIREGLHEAITRLEPDFMKKTYNLGLSGFQWGWAVNAARYALDLPPTSNPAIVSM